jgi:DNA topoisomerase IB
MTTPKFVRIVLATFAALTVAMLPVSFAEAHHSYAATFDVDHHVNLEGKVTQFGFRNPHSYIQLEVPGGKDGPVRWSIEWSGTSSLTSQGIDRGTLKVGDVLKVVVSPSRVKGELRAQFVSFVRPKDGLSWGLKGEKVD